MILLWNSLLFFIAHQYIVLYSLDYKNLTEGLGKEIPMSEKPSEPYTRQMLKVNLPDLMLDTNDTLWIAIKIQDTENGQLSNLSNIVSARYISEIERSTKGPISGTTKNSIIPGIEDVWFYLIIAIVGAFILLIFLVLCILCCYRRQRRREREEQRNSAADVTKFFSPDNNNTISRASDFMVSDLAEQDFVDFEPAQRYNTYKADTKVVSTKRTRIKSFKFAAASLKRKPKSKKESQAPPPPQGVTVSAISGNHPTHSTTIGHTANQNGAVQNGSAQKSNFARVVTDRRVAKTTDKASFPGDLEEGERIAEQAVVVSVSTEETDVEACGSDVQL